MFDDGEEGDVGFGEPDGGLDVVALVLREVAWCVGERCCGSSVVCGLFFFSVDEYGGDHIFREVYYHHQRCHCVKYDDNSMYTCAGTTAKINNDDDMTHDRR